MTRSSYSLSSASLAVLWWRVFWRDCGRLRARLRSMPWLCSVSRACSSSRFMTQLPALWRLSVRVICLVAALAYTAASLMSDYEYGLGIRTHEATAFYRSANLFPLSRERRSAPGYITIVRSDHKHTDLIARAIQFDPNAADLWLGLLVMRLQENDGVGAYAAVLGLQKLAPKVVTIR